MSRTSHLAQAQGAQPATVFTASDAPRINLNTASAEELERLPGIGHSLARRIIEHRERYGPFRRTEHLMMVHGISDQRFREMRAMLIVE